MVCLKPTLYCSGFSFPKTVLGQNKPAKQKSSLRTELFIPKKITGETEERLTAGMENGSKTSVEQLTHTHYTMDWKIYKWATETPSSYLSIGLVH